ncbi:MAG: DUF697 domain-containing protein [Peptococcaceae bacterium]|jgi:uncharacterized protein (DUF697 family)|nr:DUF697 domain-containing protein [Peptococcaceae bacterium]
MSDTDKKDYEDELMTDIQDYEIKKMLEEADSAVLGFAGAAGATGAVPIPFADAPLLVAEQVVMMLRINTIFKIDVSKDILKSLATAAIGVGGATVVGKTVAANLLKMIPGVGTLAGGAVSAATAGVITLALGKAYIQVCKAVKMGKLDQGDLTREAGMEAMKAAFKEQLRKTKNKPEKNKNDSREV